MRPVCTVMQVIRLYSTAGKLLLLHGATRRASGVWENVHVMSLLECSGEVGVVRWGGRGGGRMPLAKWG